jgi:hypothetical protein
MARPPLHGNIDAHLQESALQLVNVERVSAVTVLDSLDALCGPSGRPDRIISGFQVFVCFFLSTAKHHKSLICTSHQERVGIPLPFSLQAVMSPELVAFMMLCASCLWAGLANAGQWRQPPRDVR